jgi:hypothetical protein
MFAGFLGATVALNFQTTRNKSNARVGCRQHKRRCVSMQYLTAAAVFLQISCRAQLVKL